MQMPRRAKNRFSFALSRPVLVHHTFPERTADMAPPSTCGACFIGRRACLRRRRGSARPRGVLRARLASRRAGRPAYSRRTPLRVRLASRPGGDRARARPTRSPCPSARPPRSIPRTPARTARPGRTRPRSPRARSTCPSATSSASVSAGSRVFPMFDQELRKTARHDATFPAVAWGVGEHNTCTHVDNRETLFHLASWGFIARVSRDVTRALPRRTSAFGFEACLGSRFHAKKARRRRRRRRGNAPFSRTRARALGVAGCSVGRRTRRSRARQRVAAPPKSNTAAAPTPSRATTPPRVAARRARGEPAGLERGPRRGVRHAPVAAGQRRRRRGLTGATAWRACSRARRARVCWASSAEAGTIWGRTTSTGG